MSDPDERPDQEELELQERAAEFGVAAEFIRLERDPDGGVNVIIDTGSRGGGMWNSGGC